MKSKGVEEAPAVEKTNVDVSKTNATANGTSAAQTNQTTLGPDTSNDNKAVDELSEEELLERNEDNTRKEMEKKQKIQDKFNKVSDEDKFNAISEQLGMELV